MRYWRLEPGLRNRTVLVLAAAVLASLPVMAEQGRGLSARVERLERLVDRLQRQNVGLQTALAAAEARIGALETAEVAWTDLQGIPAGFADGVDDTGNSGMDPFVTIEEGEVNGLAGPHIIFESVNVHVRSGGGATDDLGAPTGLGNLIVGYNEPPAGSIHGRGGSHNLVVGAQHEFSSYGGLLAGRGNASAAPCASVSGGEGNTASGEGASVTGGTLNVAGGPHSSVTGGENNVAGGDRSSINGGELNAATNTFSCVSGGYQNESSGFHATVGGGYMRSVDGAWDWRAGGLFEQH